MVKMTKNSVMGGLLEPIKNSGIWKSVLREAVLREAYLGVRHSKQQSLKKFKSFI